MAQDDSTASRVLDAYCPVCQTPRSHVVADPGSCACQVCGHVQMMMSPLEA